MSGADYHFHQYRASAQNTPAHSKPSSRVASPTSSKPASRAPSKPASRRSSRSEDAKKLAKAISTNEWKVPGLYSSSRPSSRSNSRRNSLTEKLKNHSKSSEIVINKENHSHLPKKDENDIDSDAIKKALNTMQWKSNGLYSNPSSAANSRRSSLVGISASDKKTTNGHVTGLKIEDATKQEKSIIKNEWKAPGIYSNSRSNSRKNSISDKSTKKLKWLIQNEIHSENIDPEALKSALCMMEWKAPGVYSTPSSRSTSRRNSMEKPAMHAPQVKKGKGNVSKQSSEDPITVFFREKSRPTSRRGSIIDDGSRVPTFPIMSFLK